MSQSAALTSRIEKGFPLTVVQKLAEIEAALGGRAALVGMLVLAPLTPDLRYVLGMLGDPKRERKSLADICALGNILPGDLLKHLIAAALLTGKVRAAQIIGTGIPAVAEDVMRRAAPYEAPCNGGCQGTGSITPEPSTDQPNPSPEPCEVCHGTGKLIYSPDLERQKLALEMAQLLPKSGGIQIAQITQGGGGSSAGLGTLEKLQILTDRLLYGAPSLDPGEAGTAEGPREPPAAEGEVVD